MSCPRCNYKCSELESFGYTTDGLFEVVRCISCNKLYTIVYIIKEILDGRICPENAVEVD